MFYMRPLKLTLLCMLLVAVSGCSQSRSQKAVDKKTIPETPKEFVVAKNLYTANCSTCHDTSRDGAPRLGFLRAWQKRIDQGKQILVTHATEGIGLMPPKGENPDLTESEIASIIDYMIYRANLNIPAQR